MSRKEIAPGPWKVERRYYIVDADGENVCRVVADPTSEANARLIAVAPDLLMLARAVARTNKTEAWGNQVTWAKQILGRIGMED